MRLFSIQAKLESVLWQIWYGSHQPSYLVKLTLNILECIYKVLRLLSQQNSKIQSSKSTTSPPVLVIGNLIAGGAGKTPVVIAACQHLTTSGRKVGIISRGYGRKSSRTILIDPKKPLPKATQAGDEPLLLCKKTNCPVAVSANREQARNALLTAFPDLDWIISDDGLQHHRLQRQLEWVVFNEQGQGNGKLLPAGPLREPLSRLDTVNAVLASNISIATLGASLNIPPQENWHSIQVKLQGFCQLKTGDFITAEQAVNSWKGFSILAFTGIANPRKLFDAVAAAGISLQTTKALPDHFNYPTDFCAQFDQLILITSGKDAVKLDSSNSKIWVAEITVELPPSLTQDLENCIGSTID